MANAIGLFIGILTAVSGVHISTQLNCRPVNRYVVTTERFNRRVCRGSATMMRREE